MFIQLIITDDWWNTIYKMLYELYQLLQLQYIYIYINCVCVYVNVMAAYTVINI